MHEHDDRHDRGLAFDLATLRQRAAMPARLERRSAPTLRRGRARAPPRRLRRRQLRVDRHDHRRHVGDGTTATTGGATTHRATAATRSPRPIPEETAGPFPGDGSNGPDVLTESGVVRQRHPLQLRAVLRHGRGRPARDRADDRRCRQRRPRCRRRRLRLALRPGRRLLALLPGRRPTRTTCAACRKPTATGPSLHEHLPGGVHGPLAPHPLRGLLDLADATSAGSRLATSQIALLEDVSADVYADATGTARASATWPRPRSTRDMVFRDGASLQLPTMSGDIDAGLALALTVAV